MKIPATHIWQMIILVPNSSGTPLKISVYKKVLVLAVDLGTTWKKINRGGRVNCRERLQIPSLDQRMKKICHQLQFARSPWPLPTLAVTRPPPCLVEVSSALPSKVVLEGENELLHVTNELS
jgi:hypothetical protein